MPVLWKSYATLYILRLGFKTLNLKPCPLPRRLSYLPPEQPSFLGQEEATWQSVGKHRDKSAQRLTALLFQ